jgi:hypothetical protein
MPKSLLIVFLGLVAGLNGCGSAGGAVAPRHESWASPSPGHDQPNCGRRSGYREVGHGRDPIERALEGTFSWSPDVAINPKGLGRRVEVEAEPLKKIAKSGLRPRETHYGVIGGR